MSDRKRWLAYVPLQDLEPAARNPKRHHVDLGSSIARFGYADGVILDERTGRLVAGHGRLEDLRHREESGEVLDRNAVYRRYDVAGFKTCLFSRRPG